ncbi:transcription factor MYC2-like [Vigna umbellata]|uniref:transcription factor MYC2-like n=1 Tax=Vigna umbellata TaxID=87088 RepID=UPI001F5F0F01|nr:transcription factor MYC2-like [Vigna umbellata]
MEASGLPTAESTASRISRLLRQSHFIPDRSPLQRWFETLLERAGERWVYAIYWEYSSATSLLCWRDGCFHGEEDNGKARKATSSEEQDQRNSVFRLINSLILGTSAIPDDLDQDITDTEWFFFLSIAHNSVNTSGLLGQAFFTSNTVWATGPELLSEPACQRARRLHEFGFQTMVCIPWLNGVVELASTDVVLPKSNLDFMIKVRDLIICKAPVPDLISTAIIRPR